MIAFYRESIFLPHPVAKIGHQAAAILETPANKHDAILPRKVAKLADKSGNLTEWQWPSPGFTTSFSSKNQGYPNALLVCRQALEHGWSRDILLVQIKNSAHERQGKSVTNFAATLAAR